MANLRKAGTHQLKSVVRKWVQMSIRGTLVDWRSNMVTSLQRTIQEHRMISAQRHLRMSLMWIIRGDQGVALQSWRNNMRAEETHHNETLS